MPHELVDLSAGLILLLHDLCEPFSLGCNFNMRAVCFLRMCLQAGMPAAGRAGKRGCGCRSACRLCCSLHLAFTLFLNKLLLC